MIEMCTHSFSILTFDSSLNHNNLMNPVSDTIQIGSFALLVNYLSRSSLIIINHRIHVSLLLKNNNKGIYAAL